MTAAPWQVPVTAVERNDWPVVVVGCGPAGAIAALHLARRGVPVLVLEKERFPRDKVCGDALMPDALRALARAGVLDKVRARSASANNLEVYSPSRFAVDIPSETLILRRRELDALVAEGASRAGATIAHAAVRSLESDGRWARLGVVGRSAPLTASIVVLATGADIRLLRQVATVQSLAASAIAVRRYIRSAARLDRLIVSFDRSIVPGYAWVFPLPNGEYNVGCGIVYAHASRRLDLSARLDAFVGEFPAAREVMRLATCVEPLRGAPLRSGLTPICRMHATNILAIGENIGATLPLSGEGIGKAMETGERAAEIAAGALDRGDLSVARELSTYITTLRPLYDAYLAGEAWLARPWLNDVVMRLVCRSAYARRAIAEIIDETTDPAAIFSLQGMARVLLS